MYHYAKRKVESLSEWLAIATKGLAQAGKQRISQEIEAHFADAVAAHLTRGDSEQAANSNALAELGDPRVAGKRFRKKHLTEKEATELRVTQKISGSMRTLGLIYFLFAYVFNFFTVKVTTLFMWLSEFRLLLFCIALFLSGIVLPTIAFLIVRGHWFRQSVSSLALVQSMIYAAIGLALATILTVPFDGILTFASFAILGSLSWLRIWNKVRKTGENGNGMPTPA